MNSIEYFTNKNKIIHEVTGFDLVPNNQLIDIPITKKMVEDMEEYVNSTSGRSTEKDGTVYLTYFHYAVVIHLTDKNCLYCGTYKSHNCKGCPLNDNNNNCFQEGSTYQRTVPLLGSLSVDRKRYIQDQLYDLAKEFVKAHKGKL